MTLPWTDWQFWTVTVAAVWGAWTLGRQMVPRKGDKSPPCGACASGAAARCKPASVTAVRTSPLVVVDERR